MPFLARHGAIAAAVLLVSGTALAASDAELAEIRARIKTLEERRAEDALLIRDLQQRLQRRDQTAATAAARPATASPSDFNPGVSVVLDGKLGAFGRDPDEYALAASRSPAKAPASAACSSARRRSTRSPTSTTCFLAA